MAIIKKTLFADNLDKYNTFVTDTDPLSKYFKLTELPDTFTGGKNAFLIQGSEYLVADSLIKIELKDSKGDIIYHEPGEGIVSASVNGEPIVTEYYEGVSKVVSVYIYPDTAYGPCTITILGELASYDNNGINTPIPANWEGSYNVKWQKEINVVPSLANDTRIRFYRRPTAFISEILNPIYSFVGDTKVASAVTQSFANIKLSNLETFAGDVKRVKVFRTSIGDISDYDLIQDILVESKELLTTNELTGSVVGNTGIFTSEVLKTQWNTGSLNTFLTSSRVEAGVRLTGSGLFTYTQSLDLKSTNTYELNLDVFYSSSTDSNLGIYLVSGSTSSSIATLIGTQPTKNLLDTTIPFKIDKDYPTASLYFSQSQGEWHLGNISLKLSEDTAFSPDEIGFITTMPTVLGNETFNFKFEFYDINNNYVPVEVTQSATFTGGNTNIGGTILLISSSTSQSLADLNRVSSSISGTVTFNSSSVSGTIGSVSSSVSGTIGSVSSSVSTTITTLSSSVSQSVALTLSSSLSKVQQLADGTFGYSGTFIDGTTVFAPVIGGTNGYISKLLTVGDTTAARINLDARNIADGAPDNLRRIWIGSGTYGTYNNANTSVYLDSAGQFSLGNKLSYDTSGNLSVNGAITVGAGSNAATDANALLYASRAVTSGSNAASAAQSAADAAALAYASASVNSLAAGNWVGGGTTFISANSIYSPIIQANGGYIAGLFKVGNNGITLDGINKKIYVGTGNYANADTPFYFASGSTNVFSLADKLSWNGTTLSINGNGTFSGNLSAAGGTFSGNLSAAGGSFSGNLSAAGGSFSGTITATNGQVGGWTIGDNKIYVPSAITLDAGGKNITLFDTSGVGRIFIKQSTEFASRVGTGGLANQTAGFLNTGASGNTVTRTVGGTFVAEAGKTYVVSAIVQNSNGNSAMTTANAYNLDAYNNIYLENTSTNARTSILNVQASLTAQGNFGESFINGTTWTSVDGRTAQITINGGGETYRVVQVFTWNQVGDPAVLYNYSMVGLRWDAVVVSSFVEIIAGGIQVARDSGNYVIMSREGSSAMLQVGGEGTFTGDVTANTSSDIRLKENIVKIPNALDKVQKISGNTFEWKLGFDEIHSKTGNDVGVIAQEIENVLPDVVITRKNGYKGVQYEKLVALLIEAIKELKTEIDELKNK